MRLRAFEEGGLYGRITYFNGTVIEEFYEDRHKQMEDDFRRLLEEEKNNGSIDAF